jgi:hypothetical protein
MRTKPVLLAAGKIARKRFFLFCVVAWLISLIFNSQVVDAIDFYEIQVYTVETTPKNKLTLELHSNGVVNAVGELAKEELRPHEIHETIEGHSISISCRSSN